MAPEDPSPSGSTVPTVGAGTALGGVGGAPAGGQWSLPLLRVDRNGDWFDGDVLITHPGIVANLRNNLKRDAGGYFIQTGVRIPVEVEDVPWVVTRIERRGEALQAVLNDDSEETVSPSTLRIGPAAVPYCSVKGGRFEARLSRAATFQLLALAEPDPASGGDVLKLGGRAFPLPKMA
jgi:hypothetical protein